MATKKTGSITIKVDRDLKRQLQSLLALTDERLQAVLRGPVEAAMAAKVRKLQARMDAADQGSVR